MALYSTQSLPSNVDPVPSNNATVSTVTVGSTSSQLLAANPVRKGFSIYNNSNRTVYLGLTNAVSTTGGFFALVPANSLYEWSLNSVFTGAVFAIATGTNASCQVSEFTA